MPDGTELFTNYAETVSTITGIYGWCSDHCIPDGDQRTYYLTTQDSIIASIQLVTVQHEPEDNIEMRYVFGNDYVSSAQLKVDIINKTLQDDEEILTNSGLIWEVNDDTVRAILNELSEKRNFRCR